jgi:hypothetical protein
MSLHLTIPDPLAKGLEARAAVVGVSAEQIALAAIERDLAAVASLEALLVPVRKAYDDSGMSEDESFEFLEAEKHAMRLDRRARQK